MKLLVPLLQFAQETAATTGSAAGSAAKSMCCTCFLAFLGVILLGIVILIIGILSAIWKAIKKETGKWKERQSRNAEHLKNEMADFVPASASAEDLRLVFNTLAALKCNNWRLKFDDIAMLHKKAEFCRTLYLAEFNASHLEIIEPDTYFDDNLLLGLLEDCVNAIMKPEPEVRRVVENFTCFLTTMDLPMNGCILLKPVWWNSLSLPPLFYKLFPKLKLKQNALQPYLGEEFLRKFEVHLDNVTPEQAGIILGGRIREHLLTFKNTFAIFTPVHIVFARNLAVVVSNKPYDATGTTYLITFGRTLADLLQGEMLDAKLAPGSKPVPPPDSPVSQEPGAQ